MCTDIFLLWLLSIPFALIHANPHIQDVYLLNCGSSEAIEEGSLKYIPDDEFTRNGNKSSLTNQPDILARLKTLRYFPKSKATKHCYTFPVMKESKYQVKTIYYYGGFDGGKEPPVFDQIIDGTKWGVVNTTEDYANGGSSYYEAVIVAQNKVLSLCFARNEHTHENSSPFISSIEIYHLNDSLYNSTNLRDNILVTVARTSFGSQDIISSPNDEYNRYWQPFKDDNPIVNAHSNVTSTIWNLPPAKVFQAAITTSRGKNLTIKWPPFPLPTVHYYIALYFQDTRTSSPYSWRVFDVYVNGQKFYQNLNVTASGQSVVGARWPITGTNEISLIPAINSPVGPLINAGELLQLVSKAGKTITRDVVALEEFAKGLTNLPEDWVGDPCLPRENTWTGISCSAKIPCRITSLNLTGYGVSGSLDPSIAKLTGLKDLLLGNNNFSGTIPDLGSLKSLETLHLENNHLEGPIPSSLGGLPRLKEVFLQNNNLNPSIPESLSKKEGSGINIKMS